MPPLTVANHEPTLRVKIDKRAGDAIRASVDAAGPPRRAGALKPCAAYGRKIRTTMPCREPVLHSFVEVAQHHLGGNQRPMLGQMRGGAAEVAGVPGEVDAEADDGR